MKKSQNILKNTSRCVESDGAKKIQIFVHLVYFAGIRSSTNVHKNTKYTNILKFLTPLDSMHLAIFLEIFFVLFHFLIQI
jgi:hypothetical protein